MSRFSPKQTIMDAAQSSSSSAAATSKPFDISSLMSPPDLPPFETFTHSAISSSPNSLPSLLSKRADPTPLSPPVSPLDKQEPSPVQTEGCPDPVLYPINDSLAAPAHPLFRPENEEDQGPIASHVANRSPLMFEKVTPPNAADYELILSFKSSMMASFAANPKAWLRRERALLISDRQAGKSAALAAAQRARHRDIRPAQPKSQWQLTLTPTARVSKPRPTTTTKFVSKAQPKPKTAATPAPIAAAVATVVATGLVPKATPSSLPEQTKRAPKASRKAFAAAPAEPKPKPVTKADKDFESIPDYSPPLSSLDGMAEGCMRVVWHGPETDRSGDPHAHLLHAEELKLAECIRVDCATYLTAKRRVFVRRLECLLQPKEFRKTDAQQACHIDVNKASRMWTAFDKVGWLDPKWMEPHLPRNR